MYTYQDYTKAKEQNRIVDFITKAINEYKSSADYKIALEADEYEAERNCTILQYVKKLYTMEGKDTPDFTSGNNRIASNFFHRLITQRCAYSLGNGVSFASAKQEMVNGKRVSVDTTKELLGKDFDTTLYDAGRHGDST